MLAYEKFSQIKQAIAAATTGTTITLSNVLKAAKSLEQFKIEAFPAASIGGDIAGGVPNKAIVDKFFASGQRLQLIFIERLGIGTYHKQRTIALLDLTVEQIDSAEIYLIPELAIAISEWRYEAKGQWFVERPL